MKYYAVKQGRVPGIYTTWSDCKAQTDRYPNASFKSFSEKSAAEAWLNDENAIPRPYAFTDGSWNPKTKNAGYGGFLVTENGTEIPLQGAVTDESLCSMRNVAGEIAGALAAVREADRLGLTSLTLCYDYTGIKEWAVGGWDTHRLGTALYASEMQKYMDRIDVSFKKIKAHTGIPGNERADAMAKQAAGLTA